MELCEDAEFHSIFFLQNYVYSHQKGGQLIGRTQNSKLRTADDHAAQAD